MTGKEKLSAIFAKVEIFIAALLFVSMLITCGLYIDIKMNGKKSSLPAMSEKDKISLLRTAASENVTYNDDLIEPVFVGVKNGSKMIAACPDASSRRSIEIMVYEPLNNLFAGSDKLVEFETEADRTAYVESLKTAENYMLIGFYSDIASNVFLPCIGGRYQEKDSKNLFFVKNLFILPDENNKLYGVGVSSQNDVHLMYPAEEIDYGKLFAETYDISDGYSYFEFAEGEGIYPMLSSSFLSGKYTLSNNVDLYGTEKDALWVENLFDVFSVNSSFVENFSSKNETVINYVEEEKEISISDNGLVKMKTTAGGIYLDEYLGYLPEGDAGYTFSDKILAVKNLINSIDKSSDDLLMYNIVGVDYDKETDILSVYLKYFAEGIVVTQNAHDACFKISNDYLVNAEYYALSCTKIDDYSLVLPQKYSNALINDDVTDETHADEGNCCIYAMLAPVKDEPDVMRLCWARISPETEVDE